jgi:hypothetical protein
MFNRLPNVSSVVTCSEVLAGKGARFLAQAHEPLKDETL